MHRRRLSRALALFVALLSPNLVLAAGTIPPAARHPELPHVCDSGPMKGCACTPMEDDPNDICSDSAFEEPFFEVGPQCLPVILPAPKASATLTYMIDEHVTDYEGPPDAVTNRALTVLIEVKAPDGIHLLSETYQNLADPTGDLSGWGYGGQPEPFAFVLDEIAAGFFFDHPDPRGQGIEGFLRNWKPLRYYAPRPELADRLRDLLHAPAGARPVVVSDVDDDKKVQFEDGSSDSLATVVRAKGQIGFIPAAFGTCGDGVVEAGPVCQEAVGPQARAIPAGAETCDPPGAGGGCEDGQSCASDCASCTPVPS